MEFKYNKIIVHAGVFHADDVMCVALAKILNPHIEVCRVFDIPERIDNDVIVADIGDGQYDHHQVDAKLAPDGHKYAACGLMFNDFSHLLFDSKSFADDFYNKYILPIEIQDNGGEFNPLSLAIATFNPCWDSDKDVDVAFENAVDMMKKIVENEIASAQSKTRAKSIVQKALNESDGFIVVLSQYCPWKEVLVPSSAHFVVFPSLRGGWNVQGVPISLNDRTLKMELPNHMKDAKGCIFVHPARFMASFEDKESAISSVLSLNNDKYNQ